MNLAFNLVDNSTGNSLVEGSLFSIPNAVLKAGELPGFLQLNSTLDNITPVWFVTENWDLSRSFGWILGWFEIPGPELARRLVEQDKVLPIVDSLGSAPNKAMPPYMNEKKVPQWVRGRADDGGGAEKVWG